MLGKLEERLHWEPFTHQLRQCAALAHGAAKNKLAAKDIVYGMGGHELPPLPVYAIWPNVHGQIVDRAKLRVSKKARG
jgi:hypothetical protein